MLSPKMLKSKIHIFTGDGGGEEGWWPTFDTESKNAKIQISHFHRWWGEGWWPTFDVESKNAKIQNSHFTGEGVGGQLLMFSPKMLKSKSHIFTGGGVGSQLLMLSPKMLKFKVHIFTGGRGGMAANF